MFWPKPRRSKGGLSLIGLVLKNAGLAGLASNVTYMFFPNHSSRASGNRHYIYKGSSWVDPTTLDTSMGAMVGTLNADGTGGSLSYTPEIVAPTTVEAISILYTNTNVVVPILSMGFNRALTAGERTSLAGLVSPIATAAGLSPAACSLVTGQEFQQRCLKMKVNTALAGSANDTFILPAAGAGTYAYTVDWGNGSREYVTANTAQTKDYDATATFIVKCYGTYMPYFNNGGDKAKLIGLQIGKTNTTTLAGAFYGCTALTSASFVGYAGTSAVTSFSSAWRGCTGLTSFPVLDIGAVTNFTSAWRGCTGLTSFPALDTSAVTNFDTAWHSCTGLTSFPALNTSAVTNFANAWTNCTGLTSFPALNTSAVTNFNSTWFGCTNMKASFAAFNIANATNITDMFKNCNINDTGTSTNYDATLIAWELLNLTNSLTLTATNCKYGDTGETARTAIAADDLWTFVDGGHI